MFPIIHPYQKLEGKHRQTFTGLFVSFSIETTQHYEALPVAPVSIVCIFPLVVGSHL